MNHHSLKVPRSLLESVGSHELSQLLIPSLVASNKDPEHNKYVYIYTYVHNAYINIPYRSPFLGGVTLAQTRARRPGSAFGQLLVDATAVLGGVEAAWPAEVAVDARAREC